MVDFQHPKQLARMRNMLPEQCRAARGMLNWTQGQLAELAGVSRSTVRDFECCRHKLHRSTEALLVRTLEGAGIRLMFYRQGAGVGLCADRLESLQAPAQQHFNANDPRTAAD